MEFCSLVKKASLLSCSLDPKKLDEHAEEESLFVVLFLQLTKYLLLVAGMVLPMVKVWQETRSKEGKGWKE